MKTTLLLVLSCFFVVTAFSQEETLIGDEFESGGFGGPVLMIGTFNGETGIMMGGRGGWIINHSLIIGGGGYGLASNVRSLTPGPNGERYLGMGYGGLELEYLPSSGRLFHLSFQILIGVGIVGYRHGMDGDGPMNDVFFVAEPQVNATLNVTTFFRLSAGMGYRYVNGVDIAATSDSRISGASGSLTFRFGTF